MCESISCTSVSTAPKGFWKSWHLKTSPPLGTKKLWLCSVTVSPPPEPVVVPPPPVVLPVVVPPPVVLPLVPAVVLPFVFPLDGLPLHPTRTIRQARDFMTASAGEDSTFRKGMAR